MPYLPPKQNCRPLSQREVESNINGLLLTEPQLKQLFGKLDVRGQGYLLFSEMKEWIMHMNHFGIPYSDSDILRIIRRYCVSSVSPFVWDYPLTTCESLVTAVRPMSTVKAVSPSPSSNASCCILLVSEKQRHAHTLDACSLLV